MAKGFCLKHLEYLGIFKGRGEEKARVGEDQNKEKSGGRQKSSGP